MIINYDDLDKKALEILMDYSDAHFPLNLTEFCEKLRIKLIPYSFLTKETLQLINAIAPNGELKDGCSIILKYPDIDGYVAYTYYNDDANEVLVPERINYTICHEIKHVVYNESNPTDAEETGADHFSRMLLAPTCILIVGQYNSTDEIQEKFSITRTASQNALNAKNNRVNKHGDSLFDYEKEFVEWYLENVK